jgi:xylulokinase
MSIVIGVDLATAHARAAAVVDDGSVLAEHDAALPEVGGQGAGAREQHPAYLTVVSSLLTQVAADLGARADDVGAVCVTGTSGSVVPCDRDGRPSGPALLYNDQQSADEAALLRAAGIEATATSPMARIGHLARLGAQLVLHTPDVVNAGLLGRVPPTDTSHALKAGIDAERCAWDSRALEALHVEPARVPELVHPGTVLGTLDPGVAARTGLPARTAVVAGMTDGCTAQVAAGAVALGDSVGVLGTTLVLKVVADHDVRGLGGVLYSHYAPDGSWWAGGASNVGARPVAEEFGGTTEAALASLEREAAQSPPASAVRYPLQGVGERFPFSRPEARGFAVGETTDRGSAYRTFLEGVAFVERLALDTLREHGAPAALHHLAGGGSRSALWSRIRATVLEVPVVRAHRASSAYGAALIALAATTGVALPDVVARVLPTDPDDLVEPLEGERERLLDGFHRLRSELDDRGLLDPVPEPRTA